MNQEWLAYLNNRVSAITARIGEPAPNMQEIHQILQAGMSAPDHGALMPWRYMIFTQDNIAKLFQIAREAKLQDEPNITQAELTQIIAKFQRAPVVIAIWVAKQSSKNIPMKEQICTVAMATQNQLIAADKMGFAAVLITGWLAFHPHLYESLGMGEHDEFIGFLFMGSHKDGVLPPAKPRPDVRQFITECR